MTTQCSPPPCFLNPSRCVVLADFDGGDISSDGGALLLRETEQAHRHHPPVRRLLHRPPQPRPHRAHRRGAARPAGLRPGPGLRGPQRPRRPPPRPPAGHRRRQGRPHGQDPPTAARPGQGAGRQEHPQPPRTDPRRRRRGQPLQEDRLPHPRRRAPLRRPSSSRPTARPPERIVLDLDATDDPIHGHQLGRFFHGYYKNYCYLPLYIFCGDHLLCARLRPADIDACGRVGQAPPADRGADPRRRGPRSRS